MVSLVLLRDSDDVAVATQTLTNAELARRMAGDIDLNCSAVLEQQRSPAQMGREVYDLLLDVASGQPSASEELGLGGEEIVPWQLGAVL